MLRAEAAYVVRKPLASRGSRLRRAEADYFAWESLASLREAARLTGLVRLLRIIAALVCAIICMTITALVLAIAFGQSLDAIKGGWQIVPLVGPIAVPLMGRVFGL